MCVFAAAKHGHKITDKLKTTNGKTNDGAKQESDVPTITLMDHPKRPKQEYRELVEIVEGEMADFFLLQDALHLKNCMQRIFLFFFLQIRFSYL